MSVNCNVASSIHASSSLRSMIKASNCSRIESLTGGRPCSPGRGTLQSKAFRMCSKESEDASTWLQRWHFLKQLPHRIIRDIGFVISSPSILVDSHELPLVCPDGLGGGIKTWSESAKWLSSLEIDQVKQWFGAKSNNGRLGEHFAFCVEYVLLFSPIAQVRNLTTYQQVTHTTFLESMSQATEVGKDASENFTVQVGKDDVLIKLNSSCGCRTSDMVVGDMPMCSPMDPTEDILDVCNCFKKLMAEGEGDTCELEKAVNYEGNMTEVSNESRQYTKEKIGKRKRKLLRKMQRLKNRTGVTVTIGEFDFLFKQPIARKQDCQCQICWHSSYESEGLSPTEEIKINHWEVSVKFLLYAGPWEVFGFETPCHAAWKCSNQESEEHEGQCEGDMKLQHETMTSRIEECACVKKDGWHADGFLGCFLGPHVGETLYNRKTRLINQLALSQNMHAASLLSKLFSSTPAERLNSLFNDNNHCLGGNLCTTSGRQADVEIDSQHAKVVRVLPRALLKGYLFYEYHLWCQLHPREKLVQGANHCFETSNSGAWNNDADHSFVAKVNSGHWMGWWTRAHDFAKFARLPIHEHSRWYIVPKLEWLSPVVIDGGDEARIRQVFSLDEFLIVAEKVAEEAERTNIPRKRRFLVAEVLWETMSPSYGAGGSIALHCDCDGSSMGCGRWIEVSRGFVVEDTWPDSRLYKPHGYRLSLLPSH
eukprot:c17059_g1_i1 orf=41-2161(+)